MASAGKAFEIQGRRIHVRMERSQQDLDIINEVLVNDCYHFAEHLAVFPYAKDQALTVLDVGGHIGTFALLVKAHFPRARIIALEPNPESYELYRLNAEANGLTDCHIYNQALNYDPRRVHLLDRNDTTGSCVLADEALVEQLDGRTGAESPVGVYRRMENRVESITLEELMARHSISKIEMAKFDCEGSEFDIFRDISDGACRLFSYVFGEYHGSEREFEKLFTSRCPELAFRAYPTWERLGHFWAEPRSGKRYLRNLEQEYRAVRADAELWRRNYERLARAFPVRQMLWLRRRLLGISDLQPSGSVKKEGAGEPQ